MALRVDAPTADDLARVQRQLGHVGSSTHGARDVVVRFVDAIRTQGELRRVAPHLVDDEGVILVRSGSGGRARAKVRFEEHGVEIECERGLREVPLLVDALRTAALKNGMLPLHATVVDHGGRGVVVTGWSGSGKTAVLLALLAERAVPVASEWVLVSADGRTLAGVPQPVRIKPSHVQRWPELRRAIRAETGARHRVLSAIRPLARPVSRVEHVLERALRVDVPFDTLTRTVGTEAPIASASFDVLVLLEDADVPQAVVEPVSTDFAAVRIAVGLDRDLGELRAARDALRYAWARPVADPLGIDRADARHRELLDRHLATPSRVLLRHRQPTAFAALRSALTEVLA